MDNNESHKPHNSRRIWNKESRAYTVVVLFVNLITGVPVIIIQSLTQDIYALLLIQFELNLHANISLILHTMPIS